jgi:tRNA-dihydrouridine synthase B
MVAADAVIRHIPATMQRLDFPSHTRPVAAQLVGCDASIMAEAARICVEEGADIVDVNLGCPVRKVTGRGSGAALACNISATAEILGAMVRAVDVPVTAKMRLGWDKETINAPELARALQDVGVAAVAVHGRTRNQAYRGFADWNEIARVTQAVSIPVIGSGDVGDPVKIREQIRSGVVNGVIVARGMLGNYSLLERAVAYVATGELEAEPSFAQRIEAARRHVEMLIDYYGPERALRNGRKYVAWTIKGCAGAAKLRAMVQGMTSREALEDIWQRALEAGIASDGWFQPVFTSGEG